MTELYGWKPTSSAKLYLDENDRRAAIEREAKRTNERDKISRDWLADYLSQPNRPTRFDWRPKIVTTEQLEEVLHAKEAEEAFVRASKEAAEVSLQADVGDAAGERESERVGCSVRPDGDERDASAHVVGTADDWLNDPIPF